MKPKLAALAAASEAAAAKRFTVRVAIGREHEQACTNGYNENGARDDIFVTAMGRNLDRDGGRRSPVL
jgi:hypothetical protein